MENTAKSVPSMSFLQLFILRQTRIRALKVSAIVGTILIAINQSEIIFSGSFPPFWKIGLTYLVPYCVSSYSSAMMFADNLRPTD